jgi:hypothetical protein
MLPCTCVLQLLMASVSRSIDLTEDDWELRKKHKDRHRESWDLVGSTLLMTDASGPLCLQAPLFIQQV